MKKKLDIINSFGLSNGENNGKISNINNLESFLAEKLTNDQKNRVENISEDIKKGIVKIDDFVGLAIFEIDKLKSEMKERDFMIREMLNSEEYHLLTFKEKEIIDDKVKIVRNGITSLDKNIVDKGIDFIGGFLGSISIGKKMQIIDNNNHEDIIGKENYNYINNEINNLNKNILSSKSKKEKINELYMQIKEFKKNFKKYSEIKENKSVFGKFTSTFLKK